jgi:hypothetical protein
MIISNFPIIYSFTNALPGQLLPPSQARYPWTISNQWLGGQSIDGKYTWLSTSESRGVAAAVRVARGRCRSRYARREDAKSSGEFDKESTSFKDGRSVGVMGQGRPGQHPRNIPKLTPILWTFSNSRCPVQCLFGQDFWYYTPGYGGIRLLNIALSWDAAGDAGMKMSWIEKLLVVGCLSTVTFMHVANLAKYK